MILNHRLTRITVGILLLALAIAVLLPGMTGYSSLASGQITATPTSGRPLRKDRSRLT